MLTTYRGPNSLIVRLSWHSGALSSCPSYAPSPAIPDLLPEHLILLRTGEGTDSPPRPLVSILASLAGTQLRSLSFSLLPLPSLLHGWQAGLTLPGLACTRLCCLSPSGWQAAALASFSVCGSALAAPSFAVPL